MVVPRTLATLLSKDKEGLASMVSILEITACVVFDLLAKSR